MLCFCIGIGPIKIKAPLIKSHPQDVQTTEGVTVTLEVTADGTMPLHYQWYYECDIIPGMYFIHIFYTYIPIAIAFVGENKSFYSIFPVTKRNAGSYYCQVENQCGKVNSEKATVVVSSLRPTKSHLANTGIALLAAQSGNLPSNEGPQMQDPAVTDSESK